MNRMTDRMVPWISERQLGFWVEKGYVKTRGDIRGTGNFREFSEHERRVLVAMAKLVAGGFLPAKAAVIARKGVEAAGEKSEVQITLPHDVKIVLAI
jgi:hypothetical protein